jgi:dipeptidyl-peptidase 4
VKCHAGADHAAAHDHHFVRRRWDYFVRHLLGVEPPRNYRIGGEGG